MILLLALGGCRDRQPSDGVVLTFPISMLGAEAAVLDAQLDRYMTEHPGITVIRQPTPDAADQRHQIYVQRLNARSSDPDILQLDVIWTAEFAAAGWILPLDRFGPDTAAFFPAAIAANRWNGQLFALPWFVDVGMMYWRTDLLESAPTSFAEIAGLERLRSDSVPFALVWQGARYEGLVTVFLEYLGGFGGGILGDHGEVLVDAESAIAALTAMRDQVASGAVPRSVLTWQEEQARFAFQNGRAVLMRNWPYAFPLLADSTASRVAGRFAVAPMPAGPGGAPTAALGGAQLAINARTEHPEEAFALVDWLTRPEQMLERARGVGQYPARPALYQDDRLADALAIPPATAAAIIARAVPRPVTPVYTELSALLQIALHRALSGQETPEAALRDAATRIRALLDRTGLAREGSDAAR